MNRELLLTVAVKGTPFRDKRRVCVDYEGFD